MSEFRDALLEACTVLTIESSELQVEHCIAYADMLLEWNQRINLTRISEPQDMAVKHFADSASVLAHGLIESGSRVIDVGTGAGFPGLVLKILRPDLQIVLLDSVAKRLRFLEEVIGRLGLHGVRVVHARAEDAGHGDLRENHHVAVARAVADLSVLAEYLLPFVKVGGRMIAWKGPDCEGEVKGAERALTTLGAQAAHIIRFELPGGAGGRTLVWSDKVKATPKAYPRKAGEPSRRPLG